MMFWNIAYSLAVGTYVLPVEVSMSYWIAIKSVESRATLSIVTSPLSSFEIKIKLKFEEYLTIYYFAVS